MFLCPGSTKHSITVTGQEGGEATVKDLSDALAQATGVPAPSQKIIFKGRRVAHALAAPLKFTDCSFSMSNPDSFLFSERSLRRCREIAEGHGRESLQLWSEARLQAHDDREEGEACFVPNAFPKKKEKEVSFRTLTHIWFP